MYPRFVGDAVAELVCVPHGIDIRKCLVHPFQFFTECALVSDVSEDTVEDVLRFKHTARGIGDLWEFCPLLPCASGEACTLVAAFPEPYPDDEKGDGRDDDEE